MLGDKECVVEKRQLKWVKEGGRLKAARELAGFTQTAVAERLGVNMNVVWYWETGRSWPTPDHCRKLAALYNVSIDYLLQGDQRVAENRAVYVVDPMEELALAMVAIIGAISAGGLVEAWQEDLGTLEVPSRILQAAPRAFGLRVSGNSLASEWIYEGTIVVVDPDARFIDGKIYAVAVEGGEIAARRVFEAGRHLKLVTGDGRVDVYSKAQVRILGRVRWSFREH